MAIFRPSPRWGCISLDDFAILSNRSPLVLPPLPHNATRVRAGLLEPRPDLGAAPEVFRLGKYIRGGCVKPLQVGAIELGNGIYNDIRLCTAIRHARESRPV